MTSRLRLCLGGLLLSLGLCRAAPFWEGMLWAQYSPYAPVGEYKSLPSGCSITQVNIRHGARYPTSSARKASLASLAKLTSVSHYNDSRLNFLKSYRVVLGADDLIPLGATESSDAGSETFQRYSQLVDSGHLPFVRASGSPRVVESSTNWISGFFNASGKRFSPTMGPILPEEANSKNPLDNNECPNAGNGDAQEAKWLATAFPPLVDGLNIGAPGANLTPEDVYNLMALCPYDSLASMKLSPLCQLFADEEFELFEYANDIDKYYGTGYGQALGPVQGVGYINELIARLTGRPVQDETQTNQTLDSSATTFPLDRTVYADFSHDNQMAAIYSAMGLFRPLVPLAPTDADPDRAWRVSKMMPFAGRMVTEKVNCSGEVFVRIFVNDALQPLEFCGGTDEGMCSLQDFVSSQSYARSNGNGDFQKCFASTT